MFHKDHVVQLIINEDAVYSIDLESRTAMLDESYPEEMYLWCSDCLEKLVPEDIGLESIIDLEIV